MFQFNFKIDTDADVDDQTNRIECKNVDEKIVGKCDEYTEIHATDEQLRKYSLNSKSNCMLFGAKQTINHLSVDNLIEELARESDEINCAEQERSDVIPGVYEGGAKIWECTQDLGNFLAIDVNTIDEFKDKNVLDLGCGAGILGILALKNEAAAVHFHDYNKAVLQHITIPNALVNVDAVLLIDRCRFYSGDWSTYVSFSITDTKFDRILTSETIYNPNNYSKVVQVLKSKMKSDGVCYLAAKSYYFGVGGSLRQFELFLNDEVTLQSESVFLCSENVSREILKITFKCK